MRGAGRRRKPRNLGSAMRKVCRSPTIPSTSASWLWSSLSFPNRQGGCGIEACRAWRRLGGYLHVRFCRRRIAR